MGQRVTQNGLSAGTEMASIEDAERRERLLELEERITHPRSILNVDGLLVSWSEVK